MEASVIYFNYPDFAFISERVMMMKHFSLKMAAAALAIVTALPLAQPMLSNNTASAIDYYDSIKEIDPSIYTYLEREDGTLAVRTMPTDQKVLEIPAEVDGIPVTEINVLAFKNTIAEEIHIPKTIKKKIIEVIPAELKNDTEVKLTNYGLELFYGDKAIFHSQQKNSYYHNSK